MEFTEIDTLRALPALTTAGTATAPYHLTDGTEIAFTGATAEEYETYLAALETAGFSPVYRHTLGENVLAAYRRGTLTVFAGYYPAISRLQLSAVENACIPPQTAPETTPAGAVSFTQPARDGANIRAPGMSYVMRFADGTFLLIDGGPGDRIDEDALYDFVKTRTKEGEKPLFRAVLFTHAHSDHCELAARFFERYHEKVDLEAVACNFPDFDTTVIEREGTVNAKYCERIIRNNILAHYPNAVRYTPRAGERWHFAGAELEFIFTHEDFYPGATPWVNHTSLAFFIHVKGQKILMLGDCEKYLCRQMATTLGDLLKCDYLQLSHHGFNGACMEIYQLADPAVCFWPVDDNRYLTDPRPLGITKGFEFNAWIRDDRIRRRQHYTATEEKTVVFD